MKTHLLSAFLLSSSLIGLANFASGSNASGGYVAHEWGTFTSVQAADGVQISWNPLRVEELPDFVYGLTWPDGRKVGRQNILAAKTAFLALQRMETPVIYFYADEPQTVNVSVNFPQGRITEWYPQASEANTFGQREFDRNRAERGLISWNGVNILGKAEHAALRQESSGSHYYAARETGANLIRLDTPRGSETEKFLFYRGIASFEAPLKVTQQGDQAEMIELRNTGSEDLRSLFVYRIQGGRAAWTVLPKLAPDQTTTVRLQFERKAISLGAFHDEIAPALRRALTSEGLFDQEAAAMVKTWDESWFAEQGARALYILPRKWTDETLPLTLAPAAREVTRVMVGRAELITPAMEMGLLREMMRYSESDESGRAQAVDNVRNLGLGRFSEAVMRRILARAPVTREFSNRAWELLQASAKPRKEKNLAQN
jgi:hypothetical protein